MPDELTFVDATSGTDLGRVDGSLLSTDGAGRWYIRNENRIAELDLRTGWSVPTAVGVAGVSDRTPVAVVDDRLVTPGAAGLTAVGQADSPPTPLPYDPDIDDLQVPSAVTQFSADTGSSLVLSGGGSVFGTTVEPTEVTIRWRVFGVVIDSSPSDRGLLLNVAADSGATQRIVDGSSAAS